MTTHRHDHQDSKQDSKQDSHGHGHKHGHAHGQQHIEDLDWEDIGPTLERRAELHTPFLEDAARWLSDDLLGENTVTRVVDAGSGPGVTTCRLAHHFPQAEVTAVDATAGLLERARLRAERLGLADRVHIREAELPEGVGAPGEADLIWTSNVLHHLGDQQAAVDTFARALRPGGVLALVEGGLATRSLPRDIGIGRPGLEARLDVVTEEWFTGMRSSLPGSVAVAEDWTAMLARAGLVPAGTRSFLVDLPAPLDASARQYLHDRLARSREVAGDELDETDLETLDRLLDEDAEEGILRRPDAFYLSAFTVHTARAPRG